MSIAAPPTRLNASEAAKRRTRLIGIVAKLPEATAIGDQHLSLEVRGKRFGWFLWDHHGDGRLAVHCRASRSVGREIARSTSPAFHIPKYVGHHGWIGYWLDLPCIDWTEVRSILSEAYVIAAPRTLVAKLPFSAKATPTQTPNKAPEPTTMAVTIRAPSSTARASHGRGSS